MSKDANNATAHVRLRMAERKQVIWQAQCVDDLLPAEHRARTVWQVVCGLELSKFHESIAAREGAVGRDSTDPRILVALWLYGSIRGIGSARELARLCEEHRAYRWLCGSVSVNYHLLADFRTQHADALEKLFTDVIASLVKKGLVTVVRISQDGLRVRASAGSSSFRRSSTLAKLQEQSKQHLGQLRQIFEDAEQSAGISARQKAARLRAARQRAARVEQAMALIPKLQERQARAAKRLSGKQKIDQQKEPRASTTDSEAARMKMGDGGYRPAVNVQIAADTRSRAIVGIDVTGQGNDYEQSEPMRQAVQKTTGQRVEQHLYDGGYVKTDGIERAAQEQVTIFAPPKPPRNTDQRGDEYQPRPGDSDAIIAWRARMGSEQGKTIYKERASTSETINAQMRRSGLTQLTVRGLDKAKCVALWCALAYNLSLFAKELLG